jgi:hypothetical protein
MDYLYIPAIGFLDFLLGEGSHFDRTKIYWGVSLPFYAAAIWSLLYLLDWIFVRYRRCNGKH